MSYRFKEPSHGGSDGIRSMGHGDSKFDDRMMGGMEVDKMPRDEIEDSGRGSRLPSFRGRRPSPGRDKPFESRSRDFFGREDMAPVRDRSPLRSSFDDRFPDRFKREEMPFPRRDEPGRKDMSRGFMDDPYRDKFMGGMDSRGRYDSAGGFNSRFDHPDDQYKHRPFNYPNVPYKGYFKNEVVKANECEIIVVNKQQRGYAESIESRMKNLGIIVDILFLKDEALLVQTIDDIARRGSLYAIVISPLNETHGSVTLNILYGTPQEHRNMPLDDALKLIARNFHDHVRSQREVMDRDRLERGMYSGSFPADREIQFLLRLLADGRQVSLGELENVIKYLTERRDRMKSSQGDRGPSGPSLTPDVGNMQQKPKDDVDIAKKEQDLQNRIMNIMNQGPPPAEVAGAQGGQNKPAVGMNMPGLGPDTQGPRPNQPQLSTNMVVGSPARMPIGQNQQGMGPSRSGLGPLPSGMANQPGMDANRPGMDANRPGMDPNRPGMDPNRPGMDSNRPGMDANRPGMDANRPGMVRNQPGLGPNQSSMGPMHGNTESQANPNSGSNQPPSAASAYINFDNPSVKKALDDLMQSGPSLLKNISLSSASTPTSQGMNTSANKVPPSNLSSGMGHQRGSSGMGDVGSVTLQQASNLGPMQGGNMGPPQGANMGHMQGRNMGQPHNMGSRQGQNMGPNPMSGMGPRSPYQASQGMYGSNMIGNRPPHMGGGGGGLMGNPGMTGGGGPRRY